VSGGWPSFDAPTREIIASRVALLARDKNSLRGETPDRVMKFFDLWSGGVPTESIAAQGYGAREQEALLFLAGCSDVPFLHRPTNGGNGHSRSYDNPSPPANPPQGEAKEKGPPVANAAMTPDTTPTVQPDEPAYPRYIDLPDGRVVPNPAYQGSALSDTGGGSSPGSHGGPRRFESSEPDSPVGVTPVTAPAETGAEQPDIDVLMDRLEKISAEMGIPSRPRNLQEPPVPSYPWRPEKSPARGVEQLSDDAGPPGYRSPGPRDEAPMRQSPTASRPSPEGGLTREYDVVPTWKVAMMFAVIVGVAASFLLGLFEITHRLASPASYLGPMETLVVVPVGLAAVGLMAAVIR
jgi:hypothetical protein